MLSMSREADYIGTRERPGPWLRLRPRPWIGFFPRPLPRPGQSK